MNGASIAGVWTDKLAGIRQVCPQSAVAVQKDPELAMDLRQQEWWAPVGQHLAVRAVDAVTAGYA